MSVKRKKIDGEDELDTSTKVNKKVKFEKPTESPKKSVEKKKDKKKKSGKDSSPKSEVQFEKPTAESPIEKSLEKKEKKKKSGKDSAVKTKKVKFEQTETADNNEEKENKKKSKESPKRKKLSEKIEAKKQTLKDKFGKKLKTTPTSDKEPIDPEKKAKLKEEKKKLREDRRKKDKEDGVFDIGVRAKQVWEEVRREDCGAARKSELLNELHQLVKGNVGKIIFAHDTVRVIECLVALGDENIRDALFEEMKGDIISMAKSKFACFFVQKLVKYGNKAQRDAIFKELEGRVCELTKHKIANTLVEACYNDYCNAAQRNRFLQEFFGPEFRHFKENDARTVIQLMQKHPEKRRDILKHLASNVNPLITKGCYNHSLVHTVLYNYMIGLNHQIEAMPSESERRSKERSEFIASLREVCVHIVHSHDGARLTMNAIWHGTAKDRKAIIKSFKTFMVKTANEEHGYMAILAILDSVDDTKLIGKAVLGEMLASDEIIDDMFGLNHKIDAKDSETEKLSKEKAAEKSAEKARKVFTFALVGRDKTFFHPDVLENLAKGDGNANSKKDADIRRKEVAEALHEPLCNYASKCPDKFLSSNALTLFLGALINSCPEGNEACSKLLEKLAKKIAQPFTPDDGMNLIESPAVHRLTKKILAKNNFFQTLLDQFDPQTLQNCLSCNRGAFLFVAVTELENPEGLKLVKNMLKNHLDVLKKQDKQTNKGAGILLAKIQ